MRKIGNFLWIDEKDGNYVLSMTPELQDDVGTVGYVEFTHEKELKSGDVIARIEASKTVLDIYSPISGKIVKLNLDAESTPTLLNDADSSKSWLAILSDVPAAEYDELPEA